MRNLLSIVALVAVGVLLAGCPDDKKDANAPASSSTAAAATATASGSATPKAAGTDSKGSGW
jgi:uncharacterized lipoprotein YbaY